jgi:hypothetical protein
MIVEMDHPLMGRVRTLGQPVTFSRSRTGAYDRAAPWLGQRTAQVPGELGLTDAEIGELTKERRRVRPASGGAARRTPGPVSGERSATYRERAGYNDE